MQDAQGHKVGSAKFGSVWVPCVLASSTSILILDPTVIQYRQYLRSENYGVLSMSKYALILKKIMVFEYEYSLRTQPWL